jgi:periplasmic protein TonB
MKFKFLHGLMSLSGWIGAQQELPLSRPLEAKRDTELVFCIVEAEPSIPGGERALFQWLHENLRYPVLARENRTEGTVYLGFILNPDGTISEITVKRGLKDGCTEEAIRLLQALPKRSPMRRKKSFTLPIRFKLN